MGDEQPLALFGHDLRGDRPDFAVADFFEDAEVVLDGTVVDGTVFLVLLLVRDRDLEFLHVHDGFALDEVADAGEPIYFGAGDLALAPAVLSEDVVHAPGDLIVVERDGREERLEVRDEFLEDVFVELDQLGAPGLGDGLRVGVRPSRDFLLGLIFVGEDLADAFCGLVEAVVVFEQIEEPGEGFAFLLLVHELHDLLEPEALVADEVEEVADEAELPVVVGVVGVVFDDEFLEGDGGLDVLAGLDLLVVALAGDVDEIVVVELAAVVGDLVELVFVGELVRDILVGDALRLIEDDLVDFLDYAEVLFVLDVELEFGGRVAQPLERGEPLLFVEGREVLLRREYLVQLFGLYILRIFQSFLQYEVHPILIIRNLSVLIPTSL